MYEIEFYETEDGKCPIWDFLEALRLKAPTNKDARIQHKQASRWHLGASAWKQSCILLFLSKRYLCTTSSVSKEVSKNA